jgi:hypothetical protein
MSHFFKFANLSRLFRYLLANAVEADPQLALECTGILDSIIRTHSTTELSILENEAAIIIHEWDKHFEDGFGFYAFAEMVQMQFLHNVEFNIELRSPSIKLRDLCALVMQQAYQQC